MAEEEGSWDATVEEWLISEGYCYAAGLAQATDAAFYAAAPVADEAGWGFIFKEDREEEDVKDDGTTTKNSINEAGCLQCVVRTGKAPPEGLWLGGEKYTVESHDPNFTSGDCTFVKIHASRPGKGVTIMSTGSQIIAGFYSEEKKQSADNCSACVVRFAEYMKSIGY
mmetsp:Transcript_29598/g.89608  ORF Transcript_29598/g.89608 Transcript_29598/m.89608 type:complete len:168 (-) Transcript_29598:60-563(-)